MDVNKNNDTEEFDDEQEMFVVDHLLIRDLDSGEELVNQRGSSTNQDLRDSE